MKKQNLFFIILLFLGNMILYAQCSVNAGGNATICGTSYTLQGSSSGSTNGNPTWTLVSKPSGAPDPVISNVNSLTPNITGMTSPGNYVFQVAQNCSPSGTVTSQVTITAPGDVSTFTAGPDINNVSALTGTAILSGVIPPGYTASWTYYNVFSWERSGIVSTQNATMTNITAANPTITLTQKADHDIDPAYRVIMRITSTLNPNCWYEDDAYVRFIPNPQLVVPATTNFCKSTSSYYIDLPSSSPAFSTDQPNTSGNPSFGTTVALNTISQPAGATGTVTYSNLENRRLYITGITATGTYVFTITVSNTNGTYTTQQMTFNYNGVQPGALDFIDSAHPEQMALYSAGSTGGAVYCGMVGNTTPITFYFKINPTDSPAIVTTVSNTGITPPGGSPSLSVVSGTGTMNRSVTVTPPAGGWRAGTYSININCGNGNCNQTNTYYIHISDGSRPNVTVPNTTVCYPGSGVVTTTVPLPAVYKGIVNSSYFQDFNSGQYNITLVSKPAGASNPTYDPATLRTITNTSTTISNLDKEGQYVFHIKAAKKTSGVGDFLDKEYACSGTSLESDFSIFVSAQVGANAGSAQTLIGTSQTIFNANNPGAVATGAWTLLTKPSGATDPVIAMPSAYNTSVTGFNTPGVYTFRWTLTTGTCTSTSDLTVNVVTAAPGGVSGADFWVKSDDAGTIATAWKDNSANADNIPNVGGIALSTADRNHNFHPYTTGYTTSKYFYNTNSVLNSTNNYLDPSMRSSVSVFSAVRPTSTNGSGRITGIDDDANAAEPGISINSGIPYIYKYFGNGVAQSNNNIMSATNAFTVNKSSVFSAIQDQAGNTGRGERRLGLDGIYESFNLGSTTNTFNVLGRNLKIGYASWDVNGAFPGDIMEVIWYKKALTLNEQSRVNSYLAVKNGTTLSENYLSTDSNIVWDITVNNGYNNNIFGIARDNITLLHQKQSGSVNVGQKLVISTTGFADTNAANGTVISNDLQYLMTGDNGLKQSLTTPLNYTAGSNGATNYRFESIWKVQNTNSVGTVTVAWPKGVKNLYLVQSPDAVFDATDTFTPMTTEVTVNGVVYNTANVTLGNGQYFTFAGFAQAPGGVVGPDFWVKSDDTGTISTAWKDNSNNADDIPNVGGITLSAADRNHNFYPYTTGYSSSKYFHNGVSVMNPLGNVELPNTNTSIFSAVRPTSTAGGRIIGIDNDPANAAEPGVSITAAGRPRQYEFWQDTTSSDFSTAFNNGISNVYSAIANNNTANGGTSTITGGEKRLGLNGSYESFSGFAATNKFQIYGTNLRLGYATWDVSGAFPGDIMEIAWYNRTLTVNEQSRVNSYLAVKNGVTLNENYLSTNSSVVWDRTVNTGYNNNIFGIAKDDFTALHQKQAGSVNDAQKLVISTTGFADSNAANSTGLANDLQFLMTGDNGLFQGLKTPLAYTAGSNGAANYRFESIWKVQNTGNVGTVTVAWPKGIKNLYLVQSPDAVFDGTDTFTPMATEVTVNGVVYNTANVTMGNGQFFTFAGFGNAPGGVASGLSYWYRADKNVANTGAATDVTGWTDVWNGTTVAQMGTNILPKYALGASNYFNFNPGINFTATTQSLGNIAVQTLTSLNYDIFTLTKEGMSGTRFFNIGRNNTAFSGDNWDSPAFEPGGSVVRRNNAGGGPVYWANPGNTFVAGIPSIAYTTFTDINLKRGVNGSSLLGPVSNHSAIGAVTGGHIFGRNSGTLTGGDDAGFIGHIGETIIYGSGVLTPAERRKVDSYLAIKYGITLGQVATDHYLNTDGNIVWNGGTNTAYNNNIFGVSRDDIEMLEQKVSKSVNTGTILTVATSNDFVNPNQDAARTGFANDKTYFLLGDNNNVTTTLSSITVNGFTGGSRIPRIWLSQRANTSGTMYFGADLSSYGAGFGSGDPVKMIIADDAAFTTNVVYVNGTYDATAGKWVHSHNFDSENANRYITYATADEVACTTGCNDNTYLNAVNPNTIEYDNMVASEETTIVRQKDGSFYVWGFGVSPNVSPSNSNLVLDLLTPTKIDPATVLPGSGSGFNYIGTPLKATTGGGSVSGTDALILLTTDGLYTWGHSLLPFSLRNSGSLRFGKQSVNGKADGLPPGVSPTNVKMMVANQNSLTITTCSGAVWSYNSNYYGDGTPDSSANDVIWHRVMRSATQTLDNVVAVRGIWNTKFALTADGKLYTWGYRTFLGNGTAAAISNYATEISVPAGVTPKMIGMTEGLNEGESSYYLLATNGKLYSMGYNGERQLGLGDTTIRLNWTEVTATSGSNTLGGNIAWISPAEHTNDYPSINVLTTDGKQWGWGYNLRQQLGAGSSSGIDPRYMPGNGTGANELGLNDKVIAVEDGSYHAINFKEGSAKYGFIGMNIYGSMGDGSSLPGIIVDKYTYVSPLDLCGITASGFCYKPGILTGTALDTKAGITALNRAGSGSDNWPMVRKGGWLALESKTKAFVPNRVAFSGGNPLGIAPANFVEGMMVYDTTNKCMKMYTSTDNGATFGWYCISTQTCPD